MNCKGSIFSNITRIEDCWDNVEIYKSFIIDNGYVIKIDLEDLDIIVKVY